MPVEKKSMSSPDHTVDMGQGQGRLCNLHVGEATISHTTIKPGFRWTEHMAPTAGTDLCTKSHTGTHAHACRQLAEKLPVPRNAKHFSAGDLKSSAVLRDVT
jgi:hypothetical protein